MLLISNILFSNRYKYARNVKDFRNKVFLRAYVERNMNFMEICKENWKRRDPILGK